MSDNSDDIIFDDTDFAEVDRIASAFSARRQGQGSSSCSSTPSNYVQRDLFGNAVVNAPPPRTQTIRSTQPSNSIDKPITVARKVWDKSLFAKLGWGRNDRKKSKKGKNVDNSDEDDEEDDYDDEENDNDIDNFDADSDSEQTYPPVNTQQLVPDNEATKTWVYPLNRPRRDYQYNISQKCLYTNVLVSLPTGLGKTFIAAVVMLNFHRWYPDGKIIFMAPTRPLVEQQIEACHNIVGIPAKKAAFITGTSCPMAARRAAWKERQVFYATPQIVVNDLKSGILDPAQVVCIVVDEAHRATGDYAYCAVIRYMMSKNPFHRILALTATPGSNSEAVQAVIDNLHIGHIEVRTDESLDTRPYIHEKQVELQTVPLNDRINKLRDKLASLMSDVGLRQLYSEGILYSPDAISLNYFSCHMAMKKLRGHQKKYFPVLKALSTLARGMGYLLEESVTRFAELMPDFVALKVIKSSSKFNDLKDELDNLKINSKDYVSHPKMDILRARIIQYFERAQRNNEQTRVMVFCEYRPVVEEIVDDLNKNQPLIKATKFVGQAMDKKGNKGFDQKTQRDIINKFKKGTFNTLVATSIGEEGLDIGEVDVIFCYEARKSPVRMLQRIGRTGRARKGKVVVLMTEGREDRNWDKAKDAYEGVQNAILSKTQFELFVDCEKLLPKELKPKSDERQLEIEPFDKAQLNLSTRQPRNSETTKKPPKDTNRNIPKGAITNFVKASEIDWVKPTRKSTQKQRELLREKGFLPPEKYKLMLDNAAKKKLPRMNTDVRTSKLVVPSSSSSTNLHNWDPLEKTLKESNFSALSDMWRANLNYINQLEASTSALDNFKSSLGAVFDPNDVHWWHLDRTGHSTQIKHTQPMKKIGNLPGQYIDYYFNEGDNSSSLSLPPLDSSSSNKIDDIANVVDLSADFSSSDEEGHRQEQQKQSNESKEPCEQAKTMNINLNSCPSSDDDLPNLFDLTAETIGNHNNSSNERGSDKINGSPSQRGKQYQRETSILGSKEHLPTPPRPMSSLPEPIEFSQQCERQDKNDSKSEKFEEASTFDSDDFLFDEEALDAIDNITLQHAKRITSSPLPVDRQTQHERDSSRLPPPPSPPSPSPEETNKNPTFSEASDLDIDLDAFVTPPAPKAKPAARLSSSAKNSSVSASASTNATTPFKKSNLEEPSPSQGIIGPGFKRRRQNLVQTLETESSPMSPPKRPKTMSDSSKVNTGARKRKITESTTSTSTSVTSPKTTTTPARRVPVSRRSGNKPKNQFILDDVNVSGDENNSCEEEEDYFDDSSLRDFVAADDEEDDADESQQAMYGKSLLSQNAIFQQTPANKRRWAQRECQYNANPQSATPRSDEPSEYSFGSFIVPDDEL